MASAIDFCLNLSIVSVGNIIYQIYKQIKNSQTRPEE